MESSHISTMISQNIDRRLTIQEAFDPWFDMMDSIYAINASEPTDADLELILADQLNASNVILLDDYRDFDVISL